MWAVKPKRSRNGPVSSPDRVVAPDQGERLHLERDGRRARALADDHVDPEVLHGGVEQLLGRPGDAVDLVDEQHLAGRQAGHQRGQVTGPLQRRSAGDPDPGAELSGDDHRERRLAEPGRTGQQHVVRRAAATAGALQHQRHLLADPLLADELVQAPGAQRSLHHPLLVARVRLGQPARPGGQLRSLARGQLALRPPAAPRSAGPPEQRQRLAQQPGTSGVPRGRGGPPPAG
jgi:hypothetical protein